MAGPRHRALVRPEQVRIELDDPVAIGGATTTEVIGAAAAAMAGTPPSDPLATAIRTAAGRTGIDAVAAVQRRREPTRERPFAVVDVAGPAGEPQQVACGEIRAVVEGLLPHEHRAAAGARLRKAEAASVHAERLLGVAAAADGQWRLIGYIPVRAWREADDAPAPTFSYHMVWDMWLRICHWSWVTAIVVLTATGFVIANPGLVPAGAADAEQTGFFMGYIRFVHLLAAVWLMAVLLIRVWNLSTSRIPYDRWSALIPFRNRRQLRNTGRTLTTYLFLRPSTAPSYFGHNPLQQLTYTGMYLIFLVQVLTGLALWGLYDANDWFWGLFQWLNHLMGTQQVRLLHYAVMWVIILFVPLHVYLSIRADGVDRTGSISAMVSGGRWIRDGATFEDWPPRSKSGEPELTQEQLAGLETMHDDLDPT